MERKRVQCPETGRREEIDLVRTPLGAVIEGCSLFSPRCAAVGERVLVAYTGHDSQTATLACALAEALRRDDLVVEAADLDAGGAPPAIDYDLAVVVSRVGYARLAPRAAAWIRDNREVLCAMPAWAVVIGPERRVVHALDRAGWRPERIATFSRRPRSAGVPADETPRIYALALAIADDVPACELVSRA